MKHRFIWYFICIHILLFYCSALCFQTNRYSGEISGIHLVIKNESIPYRLFSIFVLPEEKFTVKHNPSEYSLQIVFSAGTIKQLTTEEWQVTSPASPGSYRMKIYQSEVSDTVIINCMVMFPANKVKNGYLNGYHIGEYPKIPLKKLPVYKSPRGYIEVTRENENMYLSPHFQLKQFVCKQSSGYPKYVVLRERLILKLEFLLEIVNQSNIPCPTFEILSGYRTPHYNHLIGNVKYSRHIYGGAADIFIDINPKDGLMDDLNKDGRIDYHDANVLYEVIDKLFGQSYYEKFIGGLGRYRRTKSHGPFVHIDVRGFRARWKT